MSVGDFLVTETSTTRQARLGQTYIENDLNGIYGRRAWVYVYNFGAALVKGQAVRQRADIFSTEGTALKADDNTSKAVIKDANHGVTSGLIGPDGTLDFAVYWHSTHTGDGGSGDQMGKVWKNDGTYFYLADPPDTAITNSGTYIIFVPYAVTVQGADSTKRTLGVAQHAIASGSFGWVQFAGLGEVLVDGDTVAVADGVGIVPSETAGYGQGETMGTDDGAAYATSLADAADAATSLICVPAMIHCPVMQGLI